MDTGYTCRDPGLKGDGTYTGVGVEVTPRPRCLLVSVSCPLNPKVEPSLH